MFLLHEVQGLLREDQGKGSGTMKGKWIISVKLQALLK